MTKSKVDLKNLFFSQKGFSLVELAIVLAIIGLIIGGVLKGQDLLESARQKSVLSQVNEIRMASTTFIDRFGEMPGSFSKASTYLSSTLKNGKGTGEISGYSLSMNGETVQFFQHLAAANLIGKVGHKGVPVSRLGGIFTIIHNPKGDMPGHWIILGQEHGDSGTGGLLTPQQAQAITQKGDFSVKAQDGTNKQSGSCISMNGEFNMGNNDKACILYFQL